MEDAGLLGAGGSARFCARFARAPADVDAGLVGAGGPGGRGALVGGVGAGELGGGGGGEPGSTKT